MLNCNSEKYDAQSNDDIYNVVIWGTWIDYSKYINLIKYEEKKGNIRIVGISSNNDYYVKVDGISFISKETLANILYNSLYKIDYIIITDNDNDKFMQTFNWLKNCKFDPEKIIKAEVFSIPGFDFNKYVNLKRQNFSIIANNCCGGIISHQLGLQQLSPFVNMYLLDDDYIKLLQNFNEYMRYDPVYLEQKEGSDGNSFPVCKIENTDIKLFFNHCSTFEEAKSNWERRKQRINYQNLFLLMVTTSLSTARLFDSLPYEKKVCFLPFKSDLQSAFYVPFGEYENMQDIPIGRLVNRICFGWYPFWDWFQFFNGSKTADRAELKTKTSEV